MTLRHVTFLVDDAKLFDAIGAGFHDVSSPLDVIAGVLLTGVASTSDAIRLLASGVEVREVREVRRKARV